MPALSRLVPLLCALLLLSGPALASAESSPSATYTPPTHKLTASPAFFTFDPFMISVVENYRVRGFLVLEITLHLPARKAQEDAQILSPRLRDSYVRLLMEYGAKVATVTRPPNLDDICQRLQNETDRLIGPGQGEVLLTQALVRPLS